jgi:hypothetical protein
VLSSLATDGSVFNIVHQFSQTVDNTDFATPGLTLSDGVLYGAAPTARVFTNGVAFAIPGIFSGVTSF